MSSLRIRRIEVVQNILTKDPTRYGLLTTEPFASTISGNYQVYPNDFLEALYKAMLEFDDYHQEVMQDDAAWGPKFKEFLLAYQQCYQYLLAQQQQQQQQYMAYYQQQQQLQAQYQTQNPQQYPPNQQFPAQQNYGQQNQYGGQQGQYQNQHKNYQYQNNQSQTGQQGGYQNYNNQQGYGQQRNYQNRPNYQQQNQDQTQGHQQQRYQQAGNQQNRPKQYNNNRYQNQQGNYDQQQGENYQHGRHHHGGHHQQRHHQYGQHAQYENLEQAEQHVEVPEVPKVVAPPQPPPKPEPKPTKYSLKEIQEFITQFTDKDKELVNKELIEKVNEVNGWTKGETSFDEKPEKPQQDRKYDNKNRNQRENRDNPQQQGFQTGSKFSRQPEAMPELVKKDTGLKIVVGKNETLEARMIKKEIRDKAGQDFATLMEKENESLDQLAISKKEIIYNLNLLAPENLKDIQKDLTTYLFNEEAVCKILIEQIIEKAWGQPKYASTYAKLCSEFSKMGVEKFNFQSGKDKKKENPFKVYLIMKVQHSFDKKLEEVPEFQNDEEKENWLKETKKKILGNVKFIAELIRSKVLKKKIMKICISQLLFTFLAKYYNFRKTAKIVDSYFDYYFEALIEFIENVGEFYEKMDEAGEKKDQKAQTQPYEPAEKKIIDLIEMNEKPPEEEIEEITNLKAEDYFRLFALIDERILRKKNTRLSALLLNLTERRSNNWQKHHAESEGPKKLKEIKEDIAKEEEEMNKVKQQKKQNMEHLHDLIKAMFKDWDNGERNEKAHFKNILKEYNTVEFLTACLNQVADEKKEYLVKRLELFDVILENYFDLEKLKTAFFDCIKHMAFNSSDYPFASATIALVLKKILAKESGKLKEFYLKTEDEDEEFFVNEVFGKLYHYTKLEEIKELVQPSKKYGNMLEV